MTIDVEPLLRLALAGLLSLPIGLERELSGKSAGVRTHLLLALTTAALGWASLAVAEGREGTDAARIASYTVAGIGFVGAGLITAGRGRVHGLTTAIAAFGVMTIGLLTGMGFLGVACALSLLALLTLGPIEWLKPMTYGRFVQEATTLHLLIDGVDRIDTVQRAVGQHDVHVQAVEYVPLDQGHLVLHLTISGRGSHLEEALEELRSMESVMGITALSHGSIND